MVLRGFLGKVKRRYDFMVCFGAFYNNRKSIDIRITIDKDQLNIYIIIDCVEFTFERPKVYFS